MTFSTEVPGLHTSPMYLRLADHIAAQISQGLVKVGHSLPSEIDLASQFNVSSGTMRKALETLEDRGLLERRQGRGTFVVDPVLIPFKAELSRAAATDLFSMMNKLAHAKELDASLEPMRRQLQTYVSQGRTRKAAAE